jgi:succinate-semialdehyde dehydrogenase/glutarate-semialdehyde dehydrogenase
MGYKSTNPYDGQVVQSFDEISDAQLEGKLQTASDCFENTWRSTTFAERKAVLSKAAALMRERAQSFAELITLEMGKLIE